MSGTKVKVKVVVRDALSTPISGSTVVVDFSGMGDILLCSANGAIVGTLPLACGSYSLTGMTNALGELQFTVLGSAMHVGGCNNPGHPLGAGKVYADGVLIGHFTSPALIQNGCSGHSGASVALAQGDIICFNSFGSPYVGRSDFNCDGTLSNADLAITNQELAGGGSSSGCHNGIAPRPCCPSPPFVFWSIVASAGANGTIAPSGTVMVVDGGDRAFKITPNPGRYVADVLVDGFSVGPVTSYTFTAVAANHTISASFAGTPPGFGPQTDFATGLQPASVEIGDLSGDGIPDLATANEGSGDVSVMLGNGDGTFDPKSDFATGNKPTWAAIGDLNDDGRPDLAVANQASDRVSVLINTTASGATAVTFAPKTDFVTADAPTSIAIGDLNGDGISDLAVANQGSTSVSVFVNATPFGATVAVFEPRADFSTGGFPFCVAIGDLNDDGSSDLAATNYNVNSVSVLRNTTPAGTTPVTFAPKVDFATGNFPYWVAIGDINSLGSPDLAVADNLSSTASVLLNTTPSGAGITFGPRASFPSGTGPTSLAMRDVNNDGKADLATANFDEHTVSVLLGKGTGEFGAKADFSTGTNPQSVAIGDLNADGMPDLVSANYGANSVSVLLNSTSTTAVKPGTSLSEFAVSAVVPNPSRRAASVQLSLPRETFVRVRVLDVQGRSVDMLVNGVLPAGRHDVTWSGGRRGGQALTGVYFLRCEMGGMTFVRRVAMSR